MYYPRFIKVIIYHFLIQDKTLSWRNKIRMHTSKDDYLINTLRFVSRKEASQIYGAVLPDCLTSLEMKESKANNTYLSYATSVVPPKISKKFKKASPSKKDSVPVQADEEPVQKGKRVKRSAKKYSTTPVAGIVIRETPVKTKSTGKEKVDVPRGKDIELLSEVTLAKKAQLKEVKKKSLRDFHRTHHSGFGSVAEKPPSVEKIKHSVTSEGTGLKPGVPNKEEDVKDDDEEEEEFIHIPSQSDDENDDKIEGDKDKGMDFVKEAQGNENVEITQEQVIEVAKVTTTYAPKEIEVLATTSSQSFDLASKFLNFLDSPHTDAEIVSPFDVPVQHEVPNTQTTTLLPIPVSVITTIPQSLQTFTPPPLVSAPTPPPITEVTNPPTTLPDFASDPLHTQVTTLVDEHLDTRLGETRDEFMKFMSESLTTRIKEQVKDQLPQILPKEVSNFALPMIEELIKESCDEVTLAKVSSQPHSTYEAASTLTEFELKKIRIDKMEKSESYLAAPEH
ncbi:hypothetical protein Tco_1326712 [Tanacetum coccineum]